jgi:hypothetical protein
VRIDFPRPAELARVLLPFLATEVKEMVLHKTGLAIVFGAMLALSGCGDEDGGGDGGSGGSAGTGGMAGSGGSGGSAGSAGSGGGAMSSSCEETGTRCENNILYDCFTDEVLINCRTCQYIGPGTGSEYDTSCKDEQSDCSTCNAENPWNGAGCYFGGGPAVCKP